MDSEGVSLLPDSIVLLDENGEQINGAAENGEHGFLLRTGRNLIKDEVYSICDNDRGGILYRTEIHDCTVSGKSNRRRPGRF